MARMEISIPHNLTQDEALRRTKDFMSKLKSDYSGDISDYQEEWDGNVGKFSFSARGYSISGTVTVGPSDINVSAKVPFVVKLFQGRLEEIIKERAGELLS